MLNNPRKSRENVRRKQQRLTVRVFKRLTSIMNNCVDCVQLIGLVKNVSHGFCSTIIPLNMGYSIREKERKKKQETP